MIIREWRYDLKYGSMIKKTREQLCLYLRDVSCDNLSVNILSDIEKDKVRLQKSKALLIYKQMLKYSWKKEILIDLEFDELLSESKEYVILKEANTLLKKMYFAIENNTFFNEEILDDVKHYGKQQCAGILRFYLYYFATKVVSFESRRFKMNTYFSALDVLKWEDLESYICEFRVCCEEVTSLCYDFDKVDVLQDYYMVLLDGEKRYCYRVEPNTYYNLSLLLKNSRHYTLALNYLNEYEKAKTYYTLEDKGEIAIMRASMLSDMGRLKEAFDIYEEWIERLHSNGLLRLEFICYLNFIHRVYKYKVKEKYTMVKIYTEKAEMLLERIQDELMNKESIYSNIGQGYTVIGDYDNATRNFLNALRYIKNDARLLVILDEGYEAFVANKSYKYYIETLYSVDYSRLSLHDKNLFQKIFIKLSYEEDIVENNETIKELLLDFVKELKEEV